MDSNICDHTSVGVIVWKDSKLLLIERKIYPFGFACPAGHVDNDKTYEDAATRELKEEVGLTAISLKFLLEKTEKLKCTRIGGDWHHWKIFEATTTGELKRSPSETKQTMYASLDEIKKLAQRTEAYKDKQISEKEWQQNPGLEVVWYRSLKELKFIH